MLKALNLKEIQALAKQLEPLVGARLQQIETSEDVLCLGFYHDREIQWLNINLKPPHVLAYLSSHTPTTIKKKTQPLGLFLRAHFVGHRLKKIHFSPEEGRRLLLEFPEREIELRLFPQGQNIIASAPVLQGKKTQSKKISWEKVKELPTTQFKIREEDIVRDSWQIEDEFLNLNTQKSNSSHSQAQKDLEKKKKALETLRAQDIDFEINELKNKVESLSHVLADSKMSEHQRRLSTEELEDLYAKIKSLQHKREGRAERIAKLENEIQKLSQPALSQKTDPKSEVKPQKSLHEKAETQGRRHLIQDRWDLFIGKSGADNLKLLRHANAWDFWLHLKDYPGAHGILRRKRDEELPDQALIEAARFVAENSRSSRHEIRQGDKIEVLLSEVRHVKPIKGDRLGRVQVTHKKVLHFRF